MKKSLFVSGKQVAVKWACIAIGVLLIAVGVWRFATAELVTGAAKVLVGVPIALGVIFVFCGIRGCKQQDNNDDDTTLATASTLAATPVTTPESTLASLDFEAISPDDGAAIERARQSKNDSLVRWVKQAHDLKKAKEAFEKIEAEREALVKEAEERLK